MTHNEFIRNIDTFINVLETEGSLIVEEMATVSISLIRNRIQEGEGIPGKAYSSKYKAYREKKYNFSNKNYIITLTGRMWNGIHVKEVIKRGGLFIARVGGSDEEVENKIRWNIERLGFNFLQPNQDELLEIYDIPQRRLTALVKKWL